ncbi:MAG: hypothetical protein V4510_12945 [bacterium]
MAHGTTQAILGLGDGSVIGTGGNVADADNRLDALAATQAEIDAHTGDTSSAHVVAGLANAFSAVKHFASGDVNVAHGNPVTVTGIAVGDQLIAIFKDATPNLTSVALTDATIGSGTITFTAADFGANDGILVLFLDLT